MHNGSVAGLGRRVKFVSVRMGVLHVQNPLADMSRQSNFEDAHGQLRGLKLAHVTFCDIAYSLRSDKHGTSNVFGTLHPACFGYLFQIIGAHSHCIIRAIIITF